MLRTGCFLMPFMQQQTLCSEPCPFLTRARAQAPGMAASAADKDAGAPAPLARARTAAGTASRRAGALEAGLGLETLTLGDMQLAGQEARGSASRARRADAERGQGGLRLGFEPLPDLPLAPLAAATPARADTAAPATAAKPARCATFMRRVCMQTQFICASAQRH